MCPCGQRSETGTHLRVRLWGVALVSRENLLFWYDYRTAIRRVAKTLGWSVFWASTYRYFALPGPSANYCCCVLLLLDKLFSSLLPLLPVAIECSTHSSRSCLQGHLQRDAQLLLPYPGVLRHAHRRIVLAPSLELGGQPIPARTPSSDLTRGRRREENTLSSARPVIEASHVDNGIAAGRTHEDGKQSSRAQQGQLGRRQQRLSG